MRNLRGGWGHSFKIIIVGVSGGGNEDIELTFVQTTSVGSSGDDSLRLHCFANPQQQ